MLYWEHNPEARLPLKYKYRQNTLRDLYPTYCELVTDTCNQLLEILELKSWSIDIIFEDFSKSKDEDPDSPAFAETSPEPEYSQANMTFFLKSMADRPIDGPTTVKTVIHEWVHVWLSPYMVPAAMIHPEHEKLLQHMEERLVCQMSELDFWFELF